MNKHTSNAFEYSTRNVDMNFNSLLLIQTVSDIVTLSSVKFTNYRGKYTPLRSYILEHPNKTNRDYVTIYVISNNTLIFDCGLYVRVHKIY